MAFSYESAIFFLTYRRSFVLCIKKEVGIKMIEKINEEIYKHVLAEKELTVNFQPIVSISKRKIIGVESLLRAYYFEELISPESLFAYGGESKSVIKLDHICQKKALQAYLENNLDTLLFINIETSLLEYYLQHITPIIETIKQLHLPLNKIVIEINEKRANNDSKMVELVDICKAAGFAIALDDVGAAHSNLNRIVLAKPDIIKLDRSVVSNIDKDYYKQEVLRSITDLGQKIGAITIAEGVEEENEAVACVNCGVDWFQGYYFSKAIAADNICQQNFYESCKTISHRYHKKSMEDMKALLSLVNRREKVFNKLLFYIIENGLESIEDGISYFLKCTDQIECVYLLDKQGKQITNTIFCENSKFKNQEMFSPMHKGDFHISKPFYNYALQKREKLYVSVQYISQATGNFCQTLSKCVIISEEIACILCIDFMIPEHM